MEAALAEIAPIKAKLNELGPVLDSNLRCVTKTGRAMTSDPATDPIADDLAADPDNESAQAAQQD